MTEKKDKFGLGYEPSQSNVGPNATKNKKSLREMFCSGGIVQDHHVYAIEEASTTNLEELVQRSMPTEELTNWSEEELPVVCLVSK